MKVKILILVGCFAMIVLLLSCDTAPNQNLSNSNAVTNKAPEPKNGTKAPEPKNGTVSIEAALVFQSGDVKPVARTEFMLLNKSAEDIFKNSEFFQNLPLEFITHMTFEGFRFGENPTYVHAFGLVLRPDKATDNQELRKMKAGFKKAAQVALSSLSPHVVYSTKTDFQGKAQIQDVKPGEYYLFGYTMAGNKGTVWNIKTVVKEGQNSIILDQENASQK